MAVVVCRQLNIGGLFSIGTSLCHASSSHTMSVQRVLGGQTEACKCQLEEEIKAPHQMDARASGARLR